MSKLNIDTYRESVELFTKTQSELASAQHARLKLESQEPEKPCRSLSPKQYKDKEAYIKASMEIKFRASVRKSKGDSVVVKPSDTKAFMEKNERKVKRLMRLAWAAAHANERNTKKGYQMKYQAWWEKVLDSEQQISRHKKDLNAARELVREAMSDIMPDIWEMLPPLPDDYGAEATREGCDYWRGTILRRLILKPDSMGGIENGHVGLVCMDSFLGLEESEAVEFTPHLNVAKVFAISGSPDDPIKDNDRNDPVVIRRFTPGSDWETYGSREAPDKLAFRVKSLFNTRLQIFRVIK
jgi:hypothetical protein